MTPLLGPLLEAGLKILDKVLPDPQAKAAAQMELLRLQQAGELKAVELQLSAIIAEAQSSDPYTSRARPSFLYVVYIIILAAIPFGLFHVLAPTHANQAIIGFQMWLNAIPEEVWWLFGTGYLGYTGARGLEKIKGASK